MGTRTTHQVSTYVDKATFETVALLASTQKLTVSAYLKSLIERDIAGRTRLADEIETTLRMLLIGVDGLCKYHPNEKLWGTVQATRKAKMGKTLEPPPGYEEVMRGGQMSEHST